MKERRVKTMVRAERQQRIAGREGGKKQNAWKSRKEPRLKPTQRNEIEPHLPPSLPPFPHLQILITPNGQPEVAADLQGLPHPQAGYGQEKHSEATRAKEENGGREENV